MSHPIETASAPIKTTLFVAGALTELARRCLVEMGDPLTTPLGVAAWDQLVASGYRPAVQEISDCLRYGIGIEEETKRKALTRLIVLLMEGTLE